MADISSIVEVNIITQSAGITRTGFGTPLLLARSSAFAEPYRIYTKLRDMTSDNLEAPILAAGAAVFAQQPRPSQLIVGRMTQSTPQAMTIRLTPVVQNSTAYSVKINSTTFTYTSDGTATAAEITAGITALVNAGSEPVTATDNVGTLDLSADVAGTPFKLVVSRTLLKQANITASYGATGAEDDLAYIQQFTDDFYAIIPVEPMAPADLKTLADTVNGLSSPPKILVAASADDDIYNSGDTDNLGTGASALPSSDRVVLMYSANAYNTYPNAAWAGRMLPTDPGAATWKFKTLNGIDADALNATELSTLRTRKVNYYTTVSGLAITAEGVTRSSDGALQFVDNRVFIDWLTSTIQEEVFGKLAALEKVPYTQQGVAIVEAVIRGVLQNGISVGGLAADPAPTVIVPDVATVSTVDKTARLLPNVEFEATLAGAVHKVTIQGTVTV